MIYWNQSLAGKILGTKHLALRRSDLSFPPPLSSSAVVAVEGKVRCHTLSFSQSVIAVSVGDHNEVSVRKDRTGHDLDDAPSATFLLHLPGNNLTHS
jgi:hypothetical protein